MIHALTISIRRLAALARLALVAGVVAFSTTGCHVNWNLAPTNKFYNTPETNVTVALPPPPPINLARFAEPAAVEEAVIVPTKLAMSWNNLNTNSVSFEIYSGQEPIISNMSFRLLTTNTYAEFPLWYNKEYFVVRARRGTNVSRWGTTNVSIK